MGKYRFGFDVPEKLMDQFRQTEIRQSCASDAEAIRALLRREVDTHHVSSSAVAPKEGGETQRLMESHG